MNNPKTDTSVIVTDTHDHVEIEGNAPEIALGQWYWVKGEKSRYEKENVYVEREPAPEGYLDLCCVTEIGSNFVELSQPREDNGRSYVRILLKDVPEQCQLCDDPASVISGIIGRYQQLSGQTMAEIQQLTARLGLSATPAIGSSSSGTALRVVDAATNVDLYKTELIKAKEETLPALFEEVKGLSSKVSKWLSAESLALEAQLGVLKASFDQIEGRIFNVSLYAGLNEDTVKVQDGDPAPADTKLHVMQRKLFMDEECLMNYKAGGMSFENIEAFDEWLTESDNLERCLPFERCIVAFQVRRKQKVYDSDGDFLSAYINTRRMAADKLTFLYIRNGERVYRLGTDLEFDDMLFPSGDVTFNEPQMVKMFIDRVDSLIPVREWEAMKAESDKAEALYKQWEADNPEEEWRKIEGNETRPYSWGNPYGNLCSRHRDVTDYQLVNEDHLYFDSVKKHVDDRIEKYNRIVLIIQGLLDRSEVLHPHPPVKLHDPRDFEATIKLIYDAEHVLTFGEAPSFEAYRARCNLEISHESVFVGQEEVWFANECEKENERRDRSYYRDHIGSTNYWRPSHLEVGMGHVAKAERIQPKARKAVFSWLKERTDAYQYDDSDMNRFLRRTFTVSFDKLLNVSAYKKGDYKQFFKDPRTRHDYLKWAPYLLAAEDYVNGVAEAKEPNTFGKEINSW